MLYGNERRLQWELTPGILSSLVWEDQRLDALAGIVRIQFESVTMLTARSSRFADMIIWYSGFSQLSGLPHSLGNTPLSARNYHRSAILAASEATVSEVREG